MEQERLIHLENIIAGKRRGFYELGKALNEIKQSRLYRLTLHDSFAAYVKARWDMGKSQAYRFIHAYQVIKNLSPIGDRLPANESQVRPLAGLNPLEQRAAWKRFLASGKELSALNIKTFIRSDKPSHKNVPGDQTGIISNEYMAAVSAMMEQVRIAQNDQWQKTSQQAAILWNRVIREKILAKEVNHE
ncbi:hypothetical protein SAMN02746065_1583 [Desulfocicer vacuolatum DSM 3385]|uniref:DNA methylase n=1 Tax=Desulfocicer vacuolatum DSM 3385 TaxID=1121400 RepID=A0A1W2EYG2_9BACT|nr:DNA methylase [Desulfocicer vacuolatum]SMD14612.1 hypothetical protein SAMN02746065_1583 [Desulfocicer vacuolatum DSM 3385]